MELPNDKKEYLDLKGLVTYNKQKWEEDLLEGITIQYGVKWSPDSFPLDEYDYGT